MMSDPRDYTVGWICAIATEYVAAQAFLDEAHDGPASVSTNDNNDYALGRMGEHNVVIAVAPEAEYGLSSAAAVARDLMHSFSNVRIGLMVGIGGGVPSQKHDIRLGDIVVSVPRAGRGGVFQYDFGKAKQGQDFEATGYLNQPPTLLRTAVNGLKARYEAEGHQIERAVIDALNKKPRLRRKYQRPPHISDKLYQSETVHPPEDDRSCTETCGDDPSALVLRRPRTEDDDDPTIHYGLIASANLVMKNAIIRDHAACEEVLCFEMEAAGLMNHFPCLVIRGICDYSDTHKNKAWQGFAAMNAAAYAKDLLSRIAPNRIENEKPIIRIMSGIQQQVDKLVRTHDLQEVRTILNWITPHDYSSRQLDCSNHQQKGTGQWMLRSAEYQAWLGNPKQTLFCPGIPGAGKTILVSIVIDDLWQRFRQSDDIGIAYIYLNFGQRHEQSLTDLFSTILKQLVQTKTTLPEDVRSLYQQHTMRHSRPTLAEISWMLQAITKSYSQVFIVVDALDECHREYRTQFLSGLFDLQAVTDTNILFTSRFDVSIERLFECALKVEVRAADEDMEAYITSRLAMMQYDVLDTDNRIKVKAKVLQAADGMFLLATLLMDMLLSVPTKGHLKRALSNLSTGINGLRTTYEQALQRISDQGEWRRDFAIKALMWIAHAKRILSTAEIRHVLALRANAVEIDEDDIPSISLLVTVSAGLVRVEEQSQTVQLVHYTLQEYLELPSVQQQWFGNAQTEISLSCLDYLSLDAFDTGACPTDEDFETRLQMYPFFDYAARNWGYHAHLASPTVEQKIVRFLEHEARLCSATQALMVPTNRFSLKNYSQKVPKQITSLHLCALFGLVKIATTLTTRSSQLDIADDRYGRTPLSWAAQYGQEAIVSLLLATSAVNVNSKDHSGRTPLVWAAGFDNRAVVALLLSNSSVDVDVADSYGRTPLLEAAGNGHLEIVRELLEDGRSNVNARDHLGRTSLSKAATYGYIEIVDLLLKTYRIDVNSQSDHLETPLWLAVSEGQKEVVKRLLRIKKVQVDTEDSYGRTPLWSAADNGDQAMVELLLATRRVRINPKDLNGDTPLLRATLNGHEATVRLLLQADGINVNCINDLGQTPLWTALMGNHEAIISLLLVVEDVDLNTIKDPEGNTPLMWAVSQGSVRTVELLLKSPGADPLARIDDIEKLLRIAVVHKRVSVFRFLLRVLGFNHSPARLQTLWMLNKCIADFERDGSRAAGTPVAASVLSSLDSALPTLESSGTAAFPLSFENDFEARMDWFRKWIECLSDLKRYRAAEDAGSQAHFTQNTATPQPAVSNLMRQTWILDENGGPLETWIYNAAPPWAEQQETEMDVDTEESCDSTKPQLDNIW